MNPQLNADLVSLRAAQHRVKMTIGEDRFRAAQAALAAERFPGLPKSADARTFVPSEADGLTTAEAEEMAFLARAGFVPSAGASTHNDASALSCQDGLNNDEAATAALLARAGYLPGTRAAEGVAQGKPQQGFHR